MQLQVIEKVMEKDPAAGYVWCLHCGRAYIYGSCRLVKIDYSTMRLCPYEGCDGGLFLDQWDWETVRGYNFDYPEVPLEGEYYPLYGRQPESEPAPMPEVFTEEKPKQLKIIF